MQPHPPKEIANYEVRIVPSLRPAFVDDIFTDNGRFRQPRFFQHCDSCNYIHSVEVVLPKFMKSDNKYVFADKERIYNHLMAFVGALLKEGDIYVSNNNIDFVINLNLN